MLIPYEACQVARAAAKANTRYACATVRFSRLKDRCKAESTDGRIAARLTWPEEPEEMWPVTDGDGQGDVNRAEDFAALLPSPQLLKLAKTLNRPGKRMLAARPILNNFRVVEHLSSNGKAYLVGLSEDMNASSTTLPTEEDRFPDLCSVIPKGKGALELHMNPELLSQLLLTATKACPATNGKAPVVKLSFTDADSPVRITCENGDQLSFVGVIMPVSEDK